MNKEIKEILESSRKIIKSNRENGFDRIIMLGDDIDKLLDYITNLQQENNNLKTSLDESQEVVIDLQQSIEKTVDYIKIHTFQEEIGFDNKKGKIHYGYFVECKAKDLLNTLNGKE